MVSLKGQTALVTGATKRIGRAIALALAEVGMNVVVHHRQSADEAGTLCAELRDYGVKAWPLAADLEDAEQCQQLILRTVALAGSLACLVNNAALFLPSTIQDVDREGLMRHLQVNTWAPFVLSRELARRAGRGRIVNLLDTRITGYDARHVAYLLSKHMLFALTGMLARELAPGMTVNGVAPGLILPPPGRDQAYLAKRAKAVPLQRHGAPRDVADATLYLLQSDFVTGQVIFVDGGQHLVD